MKRLAILALAAMPLLAACTPAQIAAAKRASHPAEDNPTFNCQIHGNGICKVYALDLHRHLVIAQNGQFPYTTLHIFKNPNGGNTYCADGRRPIAPHDITPLACTQTLIS